MPISNELKKVYATAPADRYYIETLALEHPAISNGVRYLTSQRDGWSAKLENGDDVFYQYAPFSAIPPQAEDQAALTLQVALDNTSRDLMDEVERLATKPMEPITVVYRVYLSDDPDTVQNDPPLTLDVLGVKATQEFVSFAAGITNLRTRPFPSQLYTTKLFPGLER